MATSADKITAREGEHWDELSIRAYGSERYMADLLRANPAYRYYATLPGGLELAVPVIATDRSVKNLPPWKRSS